MCRRLSVLPLGLEEEEGEVTGLVEGGELVGLEGLSFSVFLTGFSGEVGVESSDFSFSLLIPRAVFARFRFFFDFFCVGEFSPIRSGMASKDTHLP